MPILRVLIKKALSSVVKRYYSFVFVISTSPLFYALFFRKIIDVTAIFDGMYISSQLLLFASIVIAWYELGLNNHLWILSRVKVADFKKVYLIFMGCIYLIFGVILFVWSIMCISLFPSSDAGLISYRIFLLSWLIYETLVIGWFITLVSTLTLYIPMSLRNVVLIIAYAYLLWEYFVLLSFGEISFSIIIISYHIASTLLGFVTINHLELSYYLLIYPLFLSGLMRLNKRDL